MSVPLPHGTEVTTRVERRLGERVIPANSVGRVTADADGVYQVTLVGLGVVEYTRAELLPRKAGQLRYALRRAADWERLRPCVVLEATVGSRAWGLADEGSDVDVRGAFVLPFAWTGGLASLPEDLVSNEGSATYWELEKLIGQALRADPNTLELLFVDTVRPLDPLGAWLLEARDAFVSQQIYGTFGRYALSQLKKLQQAARLAEHRALILDWLRHEPGLDLEALASRLAENARVDAPNPAAAVERARDYIKQLYRSLFDQGLLPHSNLDALRALAQDGSSPAFELPRELRPKNAYNLLRLITAATTWLATGKPELRVTGELRDELLSIKKAGLPLDEVLRRAEARMPALEAARQNTPLPPKPDLARADALLRRVRHETARRWLASEPGPFGREAPALPPLAEE